MANQMNDAAFELAVDAAYERAAQNDDLVSIVQGAVATYVFKLLETHAIVPREASVDALNDILRNAVADIAMMHVTGRINSIEAQTRQEMAEREARRIYAAITQAAKE